MFLCSTFQRFLYCLISRVRPSSVVCFQTVTLAKSVTACERIKGDFTASLCRTFGFHKLWQRMGERQMGETDEFKSPICESLGSFCSSLPLLTVYLRLLSLSLLYYFLTFFLLFFYSLDYKLKQQYSFSTSSSESSFWLDSVFWESWLMFFLFFFFSFASVDLNLILKLYIIRSSLCFSDSSLKAAGKHP